MSESLAHLEAHKAISEETWFDRELFACKFKDVRLGKRFQALLKQLSSGIRESIPLVCQDWANTKAAYRFFSNDRVSEKEILDGHFQATSTRFSATFVSSYPTYYETKTGPSFGGLTPLIKAEIRINKKAGYHRKSKNFTKGGVTRLRHFAQQKLNRFS